MSATLGGGLAERVAGLMGIGPPDEPHSKGDDGASEADTRSLPMAPMVVSKGRTFPVKTVYLGLPGVISERPLLVFSRSFVLITLHYCWCKFMR